MEFNQVIMKEIQQNNNMITTAQVVALGFSRALLSKYVKEGLLERGRQGVYILPDSVHDDMYTLMLRSEKIIFSVRRHIVRGTNRTLISVIFPLRLCHIGTNRRLRVE